MKISPSILAADFANLERDVKKAVAAGADYMHIDVMDGHFVPNITIGVPVTASLKKVCEVPLDVHLMIENPSRFVEPFAAAGADILTIHAEAPDVQPLAKTLEDIKRAGMKAGLSIKPNTHVSAIADYIPILDMVLVMTVEPGYGNQKFIPECMDKIREARALIERLNPSCELEIDGGVYAYNIAECAQAGANVFVMGTAVFGGEPSERIAEVRIALR